MNYFLGKISVLKFDENKGGVSKWPKKQIGKFVCAFGSLCSPTFTSRHLSPNMYICLKISSFVVPKSKKMYEFMKKML